MEKAKPEQVQRPRSSCSSPQPRLLDVLCHYTIPYEAGGQLPAFKKQHVISIRTAPERPGEELYTRATTLSKEPTEGQGVWIATPTAGHANFRLNSVTAEPGRTVCMLETVSLRSPSWLQIHRAVQSSLETRELGFSLPSSGISGVSLSIMPEFLKQN